ncbi:peptide/nickel transport system permease protein [Sporobacter termitidis DSM 10068]|uniref:Peptide/nickel transport system permease protein n=1 Tax=Sporobacter termitidis DSM 10068 TaxID=1123282 RepID=A0A1M5XAM2_9FIRM|nr:ABC transporter permease [Sporobacter termitidis]SHH96851.1 peptide/nickel transport system permease protein [Sporobacter termitidis DSM 10068]
MLSYIVRRLLHAIVIIVLVSFSVFILVRALPGDPIDMLVTQNVMVTLTPEQVEQVRHEKGLDRPVLVQYADWLSKVVQGDFGLSIIHSYDIGKELASRVTVSLLLGLTAFVISLLVGPLLGVISAIRRGKFIDNLVAVLANIGITAPQFWVGILFIFLFGLKLKWLPSYGYTLPWDNFGMSVRQSIMPVVVIALGPIASTARQMRSSVLETLGEDYIRTAWAKGLNEKKVILRHVIKNSLMPVITLQGTMLRLIVGSAVVVETVFVIPGMGKLMVDSMLANDYPVVQAVTLVMTLIVVFSSLIVDLLYGWIDPRIQYE